MLESGGDGGHIQLLCAAWIQYCTNCGSGDKSMIYACYMPCLDRKREGWNRWTLQTLYTSGALNPSVLYALLAE
jgi:hypothetical protein